MGRVEGEFGEDVANGLAGDGGVVVVKEGDDLGAGGGSADADADADVEELPGVVEGDLAVAVDGVVADAPDVGVVGCGGGRLSGSGRREPDPVSRTV